MSSLADYTFNLSTPYELAANTRYWIEIEGPNSSAYWAWTYDQNALGVAGEFFSNQNGTVWSNANGSYQMQLSGSPIPEPGGFLPFLVTGLFGAAGAIRRRLRC